MTGNVLQLPRLPAWWRRQQHQQRCLYCTVQCTVYILILASLHGIICFSLRSVRFVSFNVSSVVCLSHSRTHFVSFHYIFMARAYCTKQCCYHFSLCAVSFRFASLFFRNLAANWLWAVCVCVCVHSVQCTLVAILDFDDAFHHKRYKKAAISIKRFCTRAYFYYYSRRCCFFAFHLQFSLFSIGVYAFYNR